MPKPQHDQQLLNPKAREIKINKIAHSRFASFKDENDLSKLLADKDSDITKKATKICLIVVKF